jgi:hypothetical protein
LNLIKKQQKKLLYWKLYYILFISTVRTELRQNYLENSDSDQRYVTPAEKEKYSNQYFAWVKKI